MLLGRTIKDGLPRKLWRNPSNENTVTNLQRRQNNQEHYYNRNTTSLPPLSVGQPVTYQNTSTDKWEPGIITEKTDYPRSYQIKTPHGQQLRRNRHHIRVRPAPDQHKQESTQLIPDHFNNNHESQTTPALVKLPCLPVHGQAEPERSPVRGGPVPSQEHNTQTNKSPYRTRSGRTVRAPQNYTC